MSEEVKVLSESEKKKEDWMNSKWRPMMGWMYMMVCLCDFVLVPVMWSLLHAVLNTANMAQWNPLTLQGAGLFHIAMGAVLGIAAFGRTQEKLGGANNGGIQTPGTGFGATSGGFGSSAPSFSAPAPRPTSQPTQSFGAPVATPSMPMVSKPPSMGPVDDDYMPPRE
jgi:hypothetical protein